MRAWLSLIYARIERSAQKRHAKLWLALVAFSESFIFPIPPDVILIPMVLVKRSQALIYATICTCSSVIGGLVGYFIGYYLFDSIGRKIISFYHLQNNLSTTYNVVGQYGIAIIFLGALTPIPYKLISIGSGIIQIDLLIFIVASLVGRGSRFFLISWLLQYFGRSVFIIFSARLKLLTLATLLLLSGIIVVVNLP